MERSGAMDPLFGLKRSWGEAGLPPEDLNGLGADEDDDLPEFGGPEDPEDDEDWEGEFEDGDDGWEGGDNFDPYAGCEVFDRSEGDE